MKRPKITVLMSVYNGEEYLKETIESILNQTFADFEFLILNDGSFDKTAKILKKYKKKDKRIKVITNKKNLGLTRSLNKGLKLVKGKYIARMDADDISNKNRLKTQYDLLERNPGVGLVSNWAQLIDEKGEKLRAWKTNYSPEGIYYILNFRNCLTHPTVMFRKNIVLKIGGYNEGIVRAQDYELWYRLSKKTKIYQIQKILLYLRRTKKGISYRFVQDQEKSVFNLVKKNLESLCKEKLKDKEIAMLQSDKIDKSLNIKRMKFLLAKINKNLLLQDSSSIRRIGLNIKKIKKIMKQKEKDLLAHYYRNTPGSSPIILLLKRKLGLTN